MRGRAHRTIRGMSLAAVVSGLVLTMAAPATAANVELSELPPFGYVDSFRMSPDDRYVVYRADQTNDEAYELYSVPVNGGPSVRITPLLPAGEAVVSFSISPDSSRVAYVADLDGDGRYELHTVPIAGPASAGVQVSPTTLAGGDVFNFTFAGDTGRIVYHGDVVTDGVSELYSSPVTGPPSAAVTISPDPVTGGDVWAYALTSDGSRAVFAADLGTDEVMELFSVPVAGPATATVRLNPPPVTGGDVDQYTFRVTEDSARVVYFGDLETDEQFELYSVPVAGPSTATIALNKTLPVGGDVERVVLTQDSSRAIYLADQEVHQRRDLYSVPIAGPASSGVRISPVPVPLGGIISFQLSGDSEWAVYRANQDDVTKAELYSVPVAGPPSAARKLNGTLLDPLSDVTPRIAISPDSTRVVYSADQEVDELNELYSVPISGPASAGVKLNGPLAADADVFNFVVSEDSRRVVYRAGLSTPMRLEVFSVPIGGPAGRVVRLNGDLVAGGTVHNFEALSHGQAAVYVAEQDVVFQLELFVGGNRAPYVLNRLADVTVDQNAPDATLELSGVFADPDLDGLRFAASSSDPALVSPAVDGSTLTLRYRPGGAGTAFLRVTATDPGGLRTVDRFVVTINATAPTVGLVDPSQGRWYLRNPAGGETVFFYGNPGDVPFVGDWDCDGDDTPGLFRTSDAFAYLRNSNSVGVADIRFFFGNPDDVPLAGDFDGDGCDTVSIYRPAEQRFYIINELGEDEGGLGAADYSFLFGNPGDKPVVGDWDNDGIDEVGLHRESTGFFYYRNTLDTGVASDQFYFGDPGDRFAAGDWGIVDGADTPAVFRPSNTTFYFRHTNTPGFADSEFVWGEAPWLPIAGNFGLG